MGGKIRPDTFYIIKGHQTGDPANGGRAAAIADSQRRERPALSHSALVLLISLAVWFGPLLLLAGLLGREHILLTEAVFFSKTAVVTFGGAYAVLAYIAQEAVNTYGWLQAGEMLDGLGMAETTPGPLIQVVQFVGFLGAYRHPAPFSPMTAGILGSVVTTWVTFVPCFLWIFLGAPYIEYLRGNRSLSTALSAITAAVVGVIFNLAVWFSLHVLFPQIDEIHLWGARLLVPVWASLDPAALLIALAAFVALLRLHWGMFRVIGGSALIGLLYYLLTGG